MMHGASVSEIVKHLLSVLRKKDADLSSIFLDSLKKVSFKDEIYLSFRINLAEICSFIMSIFFLVFI